MCLDCGIILDVYIVTEKDFLQSVDIFNQVFTDIPFLLIPLQRRRISTRPMLINPR